jgi:tRNA pseudouridine38-40 synthase
VTLFDQAPEAATEPTPLETVRVRMTVAYDGSTFHGFAANAGVRTVGGSLAEALTKVLGHAISLTCAGRTDKGVHALGQVVSFDARSEGLDLVALQRSVNALCGPAVAVRDTVLAAPDFDARFSATGRRYRYLVWNRPDPDPFLAGRAWHVDVPLDVAAMTLACDPFIGEHDFSAFCRRPRPSDGRQVSLVRRVVEASWHEEGDGRLRFEIEAGAFCHQMVRSVVGTMVDVGRGHRRAGEIVGILRSKSRNRAGDVAPPHGLYLIAVHYPGDS